MQSLDLSHAGLKVTLPPGGRPLVMNAAGGLCFVQYDRPELRCRVMIHASREGKADAAGARAVLQDMLGGADAIVLDLGRKVPAPAGTGLLVSGTSRNRGTSGAAIVWSRSFPKSKRHVRYSICVTSPQKTPELAVRVARNVWKSVRPVEPTSPWTAAATQPTVEVARAETGALFRAPMTWYVQPTQAGADSSPRVRIGSFNITDPGTPVLDVMSTEYPREKPVLDLHRPDVAELLTKRMLLPSKDEKIALRGREYVRVAGQKALQIRTKRTQGRREQCQVQRIFYNARGDRMFFITLACPVQAEKDALRLLDAICTSVMFFGPQKPMTAKEIFAKASPAVALLLAYDKAGRGISQGSGFFVSADGILVTNCHVAAGAERVKVLLADKSEYEADGLLAAEAPDDIAVLHVAGKGRKFAFLPMEEKLPAVGDPVYAIGSPMSLAFTLSDGLTSGLRALRPDCTVVQTTAPISPGSSGGPLLDAKARVIAINTFQKSKGQNLNFGVQAARAIALLKSMDGRLRPLNQTPRPTLISEGITTIALPHAGISLAIPEDLHVRPSRNRSLLLLAGRERKGTHQVLHLLAESTVGEFTKTEQQTAEAMLKLGVAPTASWKPVVAKAFKTPTLSGRLAAATFTGKTPGLSCVWVWTRPVSDSKRKMRYSLLCRTNAQDLTAVGQLAQEVIDSITHTPPTPAGLAALPGETYPAGLPVEGVELHIPDTWYTSQFGRNKGSDTVINASLSAFCGGIEPNLSLQVSGKPIDPATDVQSKAYAKQLAEDMTGRLKGVAGRHLGTRNVKVGGQPGVEVRFAGRVSDHDIVVIQRQCVHKRRLYSLTVLYPAAGRQIAAQLAEQSSRTLRFLE